MKKKYFVEALRKDNAGAYLELLKKLDSQTFFMIYEEGERQSNEHDMGLHLTSRNRIVFGLFWGFELLGYLALCRGSHRRDLHRAELSCGLLKEEWGKGGAEMLWAAAENYCRLAGIRRVELAVMLVNTRAKAFYEKCGFEVEGIRKASISLHDGAIYVSELWMACYL